MRRNGVFKRRPLYWAKGWEELSKADWFDAYVDLYRQTHDADAPVETALADGIERHNGPLLPLRVGQRAEDAARARAAREQGPLGSCTNCYGKGETPRHGVCAVCQGTTRRPGAA